MRETIIEQGVTREFRAGLDKLDRYIRRVGIWMGQPNTENTVMGPDGRLKLIDCLGTYNMQGLRFVPAIRRRRQARNID